MAAAAARDRIGQRRPEPAVRLVLRRRRRDAAVARGAEIAEAVVEAGAVRFRPMLLTALAVIVGASAILHDPIFQGLALSLMAGEIASLLVSRFAIPVLYYMANRSAATSPAS